MSRGYLKQASRDTFIPEGGGMEIRGDVKEPVLLVEIVDTHGSLSPELLAWLNSGVGRGSVYSQRRRVWHGSQRAPSGTSAGY